MKKTCVVFTGLLILMIFSSSCGPRPTLAPTGTMKASPGRQITANPTNGANSPNQSASATPKNATATPKGNTPKPTSVVNQNGRMTVVPAESQAAFHNPLKGFRWAYDHKIYSLPQPLGSVHHCYIKWNELERTANDDVEYIRSFCNKTWEGCEDLNVKIVPRVYLAWPTKKEDPKAHSIVIQPPWKGGQPYTAYLSAYWPSDMKPADYTSDEFVERVTRFVAKLGEAWDNDPRVACVEMGIIGMFGEQHTPVATMEIQQVLTQAFQDAFRHKKVMVRNGNIFTPGTFGYYWDGFGDSAMGQMDDYYSFLRNYMFLGENWQKMPNGGEVAYGFPETETQPGKDPNDSLLDPLHFDHLMDVIRTERCNHLGWIAGYNLYDDAVVQKANEMQKAMGYRFVVRSCSYDGQIKAGSSLKVDISVQNIGSTPFYYKWPIRVALLDPQDHTPVWTGLFTTDITKWLPGMQYSRLLNTYQVPPKINQASQTFSLPSNLPKGEYVLSISIVDPAGMQNAVRFANQNAWVGGETPIGYIGVGMPSHSKLDASSFVDLSQPADLKYILP